MISFFAAVFLSGIVILVIGIFRQKYVFNCPHHYRAVVVRHEPYRASNPVVALTGNLVGFRIPVVQIQLENGDIREIPMTHTMVTSDMLRKFPELDINGEVNVMCFGRNPSEVFLQDHQLSDIPLRFSLLIPAGILLMLGGIGLYLYYLSI